MKLITFAAGGETTYGVLREGGVIDAGRRLGRSLPDIEAVIAAGAMGRLAELASHASPDLDLDRVEIRKPLLRPGKIICVGVNYPDRNAEYKDGSDAPVYPS